MAKKILSFEEYQVQLKAEQDNVDTTEEVENEECPCGEDEDGNCLPCEDETPSEIEDEEIDDEDDDSDDDTDDVEDDADEDGDDDDDDDEDEDDDEEDDDDDEEEAEESDEEESEEEVEGEDGEEGEEAEVEAPEAEAEAPAEPTTETMTVETMFIEGYNKVKEAACAYEKDEYQDHTLEMYMKENAALIATLAAKAMEEGYGEVKETELTQEMYEAHCNSMKEAYAKKMDELKEMYGAGK